MAGRMSPSANASNADFAPISFLQVFGSRRAGVDFAPTSVAVRFRTVTHRLSRTPGCVAHQAKTMCRTSSGARRLLHESAKVAGGEIP